MLNMFKPLRHKLYIHRLGATQQFVQKYQPFSSNRLLHRNHVVLSNCAQLAGKRKEMLEQKHAKSKTKRAKENN